MGWSYARTADVIDKYLSQWDGAMLVQYRQIDVVVQVRRFGLPLGRSAPRSG